MKEVQICFFFFGLFFNVEGLSWLKLKGQKRVGITMSRDTPRAQTSVNVQVKEFFCQALSIPVPGYSWVDNPTPQRRKPKKMCGEI